MRVDRAANPSPRHDNGVAPLILKVFLCLFGFLCLVPIGASGQDIHALYHNRWTVREGAPRGISSITSGVDGFLWLGTDHGLYRFDGVVFEQFRLASVGDEKLAQDITTVRALPSGLWIGYDAGGVSVLTDHRLVTYAVQDGVAPGAVRSLAQAPDGSIWVASDYGLSRFNGGRWQHAGFNEEYPRSYPASVFFDSRGTLWANTSKGLAYLIKTEKAFHIADPHIDQDADFTEGPDGRVWYASRARGVRVITTGSGEYIANGPTLDFESSRILADRTGALWITTVGRGLFRCEHSQDIRRGVRSQSDQEQFNERDGLTDDFTREVVEDREGSVWVVSDKGLDQFRKSRFTKISLLPASQYIAIAVDRAGRLIIGSRQVSRADGSTLSVFAAGPHNVGCAYADPQGAIWLNSRDGLWKLSKEGLRPVPLPPTRQGDDRRIRTMAMDSKHRLWVTFVGGPIYVLAEGRWTQPDILESLPFGPPMIAFSGTKGDLWFGYPGNQVATISGDLSKVFGPADGVDVGVVRSIGENGGRIWIGGSSGLEFLQRGRFVRVNLDGPAPLEGVSGIVEGEQGDLWLNTLAGVFRVPANELELAFRDSHHLLVADQFTDLDGITGQPEQIAPLPNAIRRNDGRLYFATRGNVAWIKPSQILTNPIPPAVEIRSLRADGIDHLDPIDVKLPVRTGNVTINYTASSLIIPERVQFRYQLEGVDKAWQAAGVQRQVSYSRLPPGSYTFHVVASNNDGVWNKTGATFQFTIPPTFQQQISFKIVCALAVVGLLWLLYWIRIQQVANAVKKRLLVRVAERQELARDLHDTFLQGMQGSILSFHTATALVPRDQPARKMLEDALHQTDLVLREGRKVVTQLRGGVNHDDELSDALNSAGDELREGQSAAFRLAMNGAARDMHPVIREDIYQVGREAIRNAFRHAHAKVVDVKIDYGTRAFLLSVRDDGVGIERAVILAGGRADHWGIPGMRERAKKIGATLDLRSTPSGGTTVELRLPAVLAYSDAPHSVQSLLFRLLHRLRGGDHD